VLTATGDVAAAIELMEAAADSLTTVSAPWLQATLLVELAELRERENDQAGAIVEAKAHDCLVSYDVNYRQRLWTAEAAARALRGIAARLARGAR